MRDRRRGGRPGARARGRPGRRRPAGGRRRQRRGADVARLLAALRRRGRRAGRRTAPGTRPSTSTWRFARLRHGSGATPRSRSRLGRRRRPGRAHRLRRRRPGLAAVALRPARGAPYRRRRWSLVAGDAGGGRPLRAPRAAAAVPVVRAVLPRLAAAAWSSRCRRRRRRSTQALGAEPGDLRPDRRGHDRRPTARPAPDAPVHVFVNPEVFGAPARHRRPGRDEPRGHPRRHRRLRPAAMPLWLLEGFADYVALRDVDLPVERSAAQIIAAVRRDGAPRRAAGRRRVRHRARRTSARRTRAPGWPAGCSPSSGGEAGAGRVLPRRRRAATPVGAALQADGRADRAGADRRSGGTCWQDLAA